MKSVRVLLFMLLLLLVACVPPPQATEGDGWRLLAVQADVGGVYETALFNTEGALRRFWVDEGLARQVPSVDWGAEVVVFFGPAVSSTCPDVRLRDVQLAGRVVYPEFEVVDGGVCLDDANPRTFLVAVERAMLPEPPFTVELYANACDVVPGVCVQQRTVVTAEDLQALPLLEIDEAVVTQVMGQWLNNTGLNRNDRVVWNERVSEMCQLGVWDDRAVALRLAEVYLDQDEPVALRSGDVPLVSPVAASEAFTLPKGACGDLSPTTDQIAFSLGDTPVCLGGSYTVEELMIAEDAPGASTPEGATDSAIRYGLGDPTYGFKQPNGDYRFWWINDTGDVIGIGTVTQAASGGWVLVSTAYCG